eukprot:1188938-Prorocentrum_minimum.AAC.4
MRFRCGIRNSFRSRTPQHVTGPGGILWLRSRVMLAGPTGRAVGESGELDTGCEKGKGDSGCCVHPCRYRHRRTRKMK